MVIRTQTQHASSAASTVMSVHCPSHARPPWFAFRSSPAEAGATRSRSSRAAAS
jgi:hypothetical protein